ncbi:MAG: redoxin domain-containing protein [Myxococcales bacterium]
MKTLWLLLPLLAATARATPPDELPDMTLPGSDGVAYRLRTGAKETVVEFFSLHCPCQRWHDPRFQALHARFAKEGVAFFAVDSEAGVTLAELAAEAKRRGYQYPILLDGGGKLAKALDAKFCLTSVIADAAGRIHYYGGIDSDRSCTHEAEGSHPYLANALAALLAGHEPDPARTKPMGCWLTQW